MQKIIITGRLTKDAELRFTNDGKQVCDFGVAVNEGWGDNKKVVWFKCSLWGDRGTKLVDYLKKGQQVYIEGRLAHQDGNPRVWGDPAKSSFEMFVGELEFMGGKKEQTEEVPF